MTETKEEKELQCLIQGAYQTVAPPPQLKEQLREEINTSNLVVAGESGALMARPRLWMPIAITAVSAVIAYGVWLSINATQNLLR